MTSTSLISAVLHDVVFWIGVAGASVLPYEMLIGNMGIDPGGIGFILCSLVGIYLIAITVRKHRLGVQGSINVPKP